jgi:PII-like signaling protein
MRVLTGEQVLVRVFIGKDDLWHGRPLFLALIDRLRREGFAGATAFQGVAGFGPRSVMHTVHILRLSADLPILVEIVDTEERTEKLIPILDEMVDEGLVTMEKVRVLKYAPGKRPIEAGGASA